VRWAVTVALLAGCYLDHDGGQLPAGQLVVEQAPPYGGPWGTELLEVRADGTFEVLSLHDARVCRGELEDDERRFWRRAVDTLQVEWERPPPAVIVDHALRRCAELTPGGVSDGCWGDPGIRGRATTFAHELRTRLSDVDCEPVEGEVVLYGVLSRTVLDGDEYVGTEDYELWWEEGVLTYADFNPGAVDRELTECEPSAAQRERLERLALSARDSLAVPHESYGRRTESSDGGWLELVQLFWLGVSVRSVEYGTRGRRVFYGSDELHREAALLFSEVCGFETEHSR